MNLLPVNIMIVQQPGIREGNTPPFFICICNNIHRRTELSYKTSTALVFVEQAQQACLTFGCQGEDCNTLNLSPIDSFHLVWICS